MYIYIYMYVDDGNTFNHCFVGRYCSSALACSVKTARDMPTSWKGAARNHRGPLW